MYREPDALLHQVVGERWRLLDMLGATEHGAAYRAETLEDGRPVRLELWEHRHVEGRGELARFEREARTLSHLRHDRCLSVVAFGAHEGRPFLVSELPEGKTVRDELGTPELTVPRAVSLGVQLCEGLQHLHRHGVVHRALLPDNVWVADSPSADILKIGLPRVGPSRSSGRPDHRADVYAAGLLLYAMCTGRDLADTAGAGTPVPAPRTVNPEREISDGLERVILRAVAASPEGRFGTADDLLAALQSVGVGPPVARRRAAQRPRKWTAMAATAAAAIAVLGAGVLRSRGSQAPSAPSAAQAVAVAQPPPPSVPAKTLVAPTPPPRAAIVAPPVEPKREPAPVAAPPPHDERSEIWSLLDRGRLDEGAARIKALLARDPDAAWPQFALGVLYYRKYWRRDAVKQWQAALEQDREIRHDPQFGAYLCFMLDDEWKAAGVGELLRQLRAEAVPLVESCAASAKTPRLRVLASRTLDQLRRDHQRSRR